MARDLKDAWGWIERLTRRVDRLFSGAMLENASITKGRMRFIGGLLRLDSGALLELIGEWRFFGNGAITGDVFSEGKWTQVGPWDFTGDGDLAGDVKLSGNFDLLGKFTAGNIRIQDGKIFVGTGDPIVIDGATGKVTVGVGASQIVIDGATGAITVPGTNPIVLRQVGGLAKIDLGATASMWSAGDGVTIGASVPGGYINVYSGGIDIAGGVGRSGISIDDTGINVGSVPSGAGAFLGLDANGYLVRISGGTGGGPGDGVFAWPFSLDLVTSEFRPPDRPGHDGIDFGNGIANIEGTPIPAAGAGVVETVGVPGTGHGWGYYVVVNHGTDPLYGGAEIKTRYAHMYQMPDVSVGDPVALGMTLGGIGDTGNSFGEHLHYEVLVNGSWVNPRTFHAAHGG